MPKSTAQLPEWERVLSAAARLQGILPEAILVGGTASAIFAGHRMSVDADHVITDLRDRFDVVLEQLESVAGWQTARVKRPVLILGSLDGIETGVRQLIRTAPLETRDLSYLGHSIRVPSEGEILRIKGVLILKRNATRDYLDFVALADHLGDEQVASALEPFDRLYPQSSGESALQQLAVQLAQPLPYDLDQVDLSEYKRLAGRWQSWDAIRIHSAHLSTVIFDQVCELRTRGGHGVESSNRTPEPGR